MGHECVPRHWYPLRTFEQAKSDLYLELMALFTRAAISIPNHAPLLRELRLLERQTHRGGRDVVDHPRGGSDDLANCLAGVAHLARKPKYDWDSGWLDDSPRKPPDPKAQVERVRKLVALLQAW